MFLIYCLNSVFFPYGVLSCDSDTCFLIITNSINDFDILLICVFIVLMVSFHVIQSLVIDNYQLHNYFFAYIDLLGFFPFGHGSHRIGYFLWRHFFILAYQNVLASLF